MINIKGCAGKQITAINLQDETSLVMTFTDGVVLSLTDDGQSCCELRYMTTDDKLSEFIGATVISVEVRPGDGRDTQYDCHDTEFLIIVTNRGNITCESHNEHNGYYGGFNIQVTVTKAPHHA